MEIIQREYNYFPVDLPFDTVTAMRHKLHEAAHNLAGATGEPVRFAITESPPDHYHCEVGILIRGDDERKGPSIFEFRHREYENQETFNAVLLVPTGIGAAIGGHAGDACPVARLLGSVCDTLITHPNVVNASDINEMPANALYVEGSVISDLLMGTAGLLRSRANRILVLVSAHAEPAIAAATINAISAARATLGIECVGVVGIDPPLQMKSRYSLTGMAVGTITGLEAICSVLDEYDGQYDAVALTSVIDVPVHYHTEYFEQAGDMVNPWGGVEAMLTHALSRRYRVPMAHAPMSDSSEIANLDVGVVDPRMSAETVSCCFLHCILKGLHKSPRITDDPVLFRSPGVLSAKDVSCLVIPDGCVGLPTLAAIEQNIPVIAVRENRNRMKNELSDYPFQIPGLVTVDNYLEAAGVLVALRAGVSLESVARPLRATKVSGAN
ncbi:hypothetical protein LCGC14_1353470 [marine sediment metagenome]|uniref:High light inducible protein n=1 Tax=marine sediment metagenome TaxID=412755 RepID=A0A0F9KA47_9ZZZZ